MSTKHSHMTFPAFFQQYKSLIYVQLEKLEINDPHQVYFVIGVVALYRAWKLYVTENLDEWIGNHLEEVYEQMNQKENE